MKLETARLLKSISDEFGNQEVEIREDYYGRGMSNTPTVGIVIDSVTLLLADILQYVSQNVDENGIWSGIDVSNFDIADFRMDNMGRGTILY